MAESYQDLGKKKGKINLILGLLHYLKSWNDNKNERVEFKKAPKYFTLTIKHFLLH